MRSLVGLLLVVTLVLPAAPAVAQPVVQEYSVPAGSHPHDVAPAVDGGVHPFGSAGAIRGAAYWNGWDIARSVRLSPQSTAAQPQGWTLDGYGGLHPFGGAPAVATGLYVGQDLAVQIAEQ